MNLNDVFYAGRYWFIGSVVSMWLAALLLIWILPSEYESKAVYAVGPWFGDANYSIQGVESGREAISWVSENFPSAETGGRRGGSPYLFRVELPAKDWAWIALAARSGSASESQRFLRSVLDALLTRHNRMSMESLSPATARLYAAEEQLKELERLIQRDESRIERLITTDPGAAVAILVRQNRLFEKFEKARTEFLQLNDQVEKLSSRESRIVLGPSLEESKIYPDTGLLLSLATVLGLAAGWFGMMIRFAPAHVATSG